MANFVVYKSSAGSGKTFTLVKEYLRLALHEEKRISSNYKRILAVTFTNKAAAEMKQRVIDSLDQISNAPALPAIGQILTAELKINAEELKRRAKYLLDSILHNYSDFSIGTIDSFTHKIVKTFAYDLNLPVNFNLETDVDSFYGKVVAELLNKIGEDVYITKLLKEYSLNRAEENTSWDPELSITEFVKLLKKEDTGYYIEKLDKFTADELETFRKQFIEFVKSYENYIATKANEAIVLINKFNLTKNDFWFKASGPVNFFYKCVEGDVDLKSRSRLDQAIAEDKWLDKKTHEINPQLTRIARELVTYIEENNNYYELCRLLNKQIYQLMLIKKIEEISREKKEEEQIVFISEFNQKIFELINNEPTPFIYERLGEKYHHYLLDEFQDTSGLQWQNILPLLDNSLANGWFNLIVGDGKQSIYRWRNANVKQFANLPEMENTANSFVVEERIDTLKRNYKKEVLNTNYRSVKTVVDFNNQLFDSLSAELLNEDFISIYENQAQQIVNSSTGYITINTGSVEKDELDLYNCNIIRDKINSALENGFSYSDICIILRKNKYGPVIANYLVEQQIPVVSSDSLLLKNNLEVNTLLCFINYLNDENDKISAAAVINYLCRVGRISNDQYTNSLKKIAGKQSLFSVLSELGVNIDPNSLLLENLLDNCIQIVSALELNKTNHLYIRFFLDEVNEFLVTKNSNLLQFTQWWENRSRKASVIIPDTTNAVKIMSIHTSKGLEFPVVILPFCNWEQYIANDAWVNIENEKMKLPVAVVSLTERVKKAGLEAELEKEKQEQHLDNLNLLYVAFTRAAERLHIITTRAASNKKHLVSEWVESYLIKTAGPKPDGLYEIGEKQKALVHTKKSFPQYQLNPLQFSSQNNSVQIKSSYLKNTGETQNAKQQGIMVHWVLSKISTQADVNEALQNALQEGLITLEEIEPLKAKINSVIQQPSIKNYFEEGITSKIESELITASGEILRPDRIIFTNETAVIIDYKTGSENNKKYATQMRNYENALREMGYQKIEKKIVYIDSAEVVTL